MVSNDSVLTAFWVICIAFFLVALEFSHSSHWSFSLRISGVVCPLFGLSLHLAFGFIYLLRVSLIAVLLAHCFVWHILTTRPPAFFALSLSCGSITNIYLGNIPAASFPLSSKSLSLCIISTIVIHVPSEPIHISSTRMLHIQKLFELILHLGYNTLSCYLCIIILITFRNTPSLFVTPRQYLP